MVSGEPGSLDDGIYDPSRLLDLGARHTEIYESEKRDPRWAPHAERLLEEQVSAAFDIVLHEKLVEFDSECRRATCAISFLVEGLDEDRAFFLQQALPLADTIQPWSNEADAETGRVRMGALLTFRPSSRSLDQMKARYAVESARRFPGGLQRLRQVLDEGGLQPQPQP